VWREKISSGRSIANSPGIIGTTVAVDRLTRG
jgi:hypothetical protein